jgi:alanyl-tRNA synthetase
LRNIKIAKEKVTKSTQYNINEILKHIKSKNIKPVDVGNLSAAEQVKKLTKQMDEINIQSVIENKGKNVIKDKKIGSFTLRNQVLEDFPPKELRRIIDQGKKDIKKGIVVAFAIYEGKIGVAVGVTKELTDKYDSVNLVKIASETIGGRGGGGRKDFAQAGGINKNKIEEAFNILIKKIN